MRGGHNGGIRKGKHDITPVMRTAFLAAVKKLKHREGKSIPELMADWLLKDPITMLNPISKFLPREARTRAGHDRTLTTASLPATHEFVKSVVDQKRVSAPSKAIHN
jgi:hypothetical protein